MNPYNGEEGEEDVRFQALFQKVRERELGKRHPSTKNTSKEGNDKGNNNNNNRFRWVKVAVYLWAGRLGLSIFGGVIPAMFAWFHWQATPTPPNSPNTASTPPNLEANITPTSLPSNMNDIVQTHDWLSLLKDDFQSLKQFRYSYSPQIIQQVPIISPETISVLVQSLFPTLPIQIKVQESPYYTYFTPDRLWSSYITPTYEYVKLQDFLQQDLKLHPYKFLDAMKKPNPKEAECSAAAASEAGGKQCAMSTDDAKYLYISYPHLKPYLESFAPSLALLAKYFHSKPNEIGASIWMASTNVSAVMHYDLEDNFLLQLSGTKEVVVASPDATRVIKPYSSLHPLWRQSSHAELVTHTQLVALYQQYVEEQQLDAELQELQRKIQEAKEKKRLQKQSKPNPTEDIAEKEATEKTGDDKLASAPESVHAWKVTLQPGDMLFIPAGFYHAVVTGEDSISINTWFPSELSSIHQRLSSIPLPFYANDVASIKVADIVYIMQRVCTLLGKESNCLAQEIAHRYSDEIMNPLLASSSCPSIPSQEFCLDNLFTIAKQKGANRRVANAIHANIAKLSPALRLQATIEYVEEILMLIFQKDLTPCKMEQLLRECWSNEE